jgi:branched-chain amino acid transport system substrate-binding protein
LIAQAGAAANDSYHLVFFTPWFPDAVQNPDVARRFVDEWNNRKFEFAGLTEGFRGWDGIHTIVEAIKLAGKAEPKALRETLWKTKVRGVNGNIAFIEQKGPQGVASAQNIPNVYVVQIKDGKVARP